MNHYYCDGCNGVATAAQMEDIEKVCQTKACPKLGEKIHECSCDDMSSHRHS